jgi:hypothetical protein
MDGGREGEGERGGRGERGKRQREKGEAGLYLCLNQQHRFVAVRCHEAHNSTPSAMAHHNQPKIACNTYITQY